MEVVICYGLIMCHIEWFAENWRDGAGALDESKDEALKWGCTRASASRRDVLEIGEIIGYLTYTSDFLSAGYISLKFA